MIRSGRSYLCGWLRRSVLATPECSATVHRMARTRIEGRIATYARSLRRKVVVRMIVGVAIGVGAGAGAIYGGPAWLLLITLAGGGFALSFTKRLSQLNAGIRAERVVLRSARRGHVAGVYAGYVPRRRDGDVDLIAVGPALAVIETKAGGGFVQVVNGNLVMGAGHRIMGDPIGQAISAAERVRSDLDIDGHVDPVVCVAWMDNSPFTVRRRGHEVVVCSARDLPGVLERLPRRVDKRWASGLLTQLHELHTATAA